MATPNDFLVTNSYSFRIVEYATRDQAQQAVAQLSNQNLMGRLVYVREVGGARSSYGRCVTKANLGS